MSTSEPSDFDSIKVKESKLILKSQFKELLILSESSTRKHLKSFQRRKIIELAGNYCEVLDYVCAPNVVHLEQLQFQKSSLLLCS